MVSTMMNKALADVHQRGNPRRLRTDLNRSITVVFSFR